MKVVVTGATGFIGTPLVAALRARGDDVIALVRDVERAKQHLRGDDAAPPLGENAPPRVPGAIQPGALHLVLADLEAPGVWCDRLDGADAIVHLAGEPVDAKRWDAQQKQRIRDSRVETTRTIVEALAKTQHKPKALVTASGVDFYPFALEHDDFDDDEVTETDPPSETFLGRVCRDWEKEARVGESLGMRVASMRTGLVLAKHGNAMSKLRRQFKLFAGGRLGSGRQWMSWIHLDDVVNAYIAAATDERYRGPINMVTESTRNAQFVRTLGKVLGKPSWLPAPAFAIKAVLGGEFAESVLQGRRVVPAKLRELGFVWKYPTLEGALAASV
ncbi:MAG TPA: TIGR01777 family oxidoreductase [Kofleriaceae bacterium]